MIAALRSDAPDLLLLDCGGVIPFRANYREMKSDIILKAMGVIAYDAMNLSGSDFSLGASYLENWSESLSFPLISSNLLSVDGSPPPSWINRYAIVNAGTLSIGIVGVMPEGSFNEIPSAQKPSMLKIIPPLEAVSSLLPELIGRVDLIVLLSQLSLEETAVLSSQLKGIDLAISHEKRSSEPVKQNGETVIAPCGTESSNIEIIELDASSEGKLSVARNRPIVLDDDVPHDPDMDQIISASYAEWLRAIRRERDLEKFQARHEELMKGLKVSPEEFMRNLGREDNAKPPSTEENHTDEDPSSSN